jgi:hypothetical protein
MCLVLLLASVVQDGISLLGFDLSHQSFSWC